MDIKVFFSDVFLLYYMTLPFLFYTFCTSVKYVHMFQLNSYKSDRYLKWVKKNPRAHINLFGIALAVLFLNWIMSNDQYRYAFTFFIAPWLLVVSVGYWAFKLFFTMKSKKPLAMTSRVKRLFVTIVFILIAAYIDVLVLSLIDMLIFGRAEDGIRGFFTYGYCFVLAIFPIGIILPPIAAIINSPIENKINAKFLESAKAKLGSAHDLIKIGVTGSYGKTSTKYFIKEMLMQKYNTFMTPESYNTTLGVVRAVNEGLNGMAQAFVCEMGAKAKGDIKEICDLVSPKYGVITAVGLAHLENFKSVDNTRAAKFELAYALPEDGMAFLNMDSVELAKEGYTGLHKTYGLDESYDFYAKDIETTEDGTTFTLCSKAGGDVELSTKLLGKHNVVNLVGAAAVAYELGVTLSQIKEAVHRIAPVPHRLELIKDQHGQITIDNAFNSNPEGAAEALEILSKMKGRQRIVITPGIIELGEREYEENKNLGRKAASCADIIIGVGESRAKPILEGAREMGFPEEKMMAAKNLRDAIAKMRSVIDGPAALLLENDLPDNYEKA